MKTRIRIDTVKDAMRFFDIVERETTEEDEVIIVDGNGNWANSKSLIDALQVINFDELWIESSKDLYHALREFII